MNKFLYYYSMMVITIAFLVVGYVAWLFIEPFNEPLVVEPYPILNENNEVARGKYVFYVIEFTKYEDMPVETNRNIICADGNLVTLAPIQTDAPVGYHKTVGEIAIPQKTSLGECFIQFKSTYHINKLRTEQRERRTDPFYVIE